MSLPVGNSALVETVTYAYHKGGHVEQIIRKAEGDDTYYRTYFVYNKQGRTWLAMQDHYKLDGNGDPVDFTAEGGCAPFNRELL